MSTVLQEITNIVNEKALPADKVTPEQLRGRVNYEEKGKSICRKSTNKPESICTKRTNKESEVGPGTDLDDLLKTGGDDIMDPEGKRANQVR